jgi:hypothetical protein
MTPRLTPEARAPEPPNCVRLWSVHDVADFLGIPVSTLHQWRYLGTGPAAFRVGKHLRYDPDVVRRWLVDHCSGAA